jgi:exonuclease SbcC
VERLLGLSFDHFTRCVVLPQGEFARFLHDKPSERQQLLASLLDIEVYARMGQRAGHLAETITNSAGVASLRLESLANATPEAKREAEREVAALDALSAQLRQAEPELDRLGREIEASQLAAALAHSLVASLERIAVPDEVQYAAATLETLDAATDQAAIELARAEAARLELDAQTATLPETGPLEVALRAHEELAGVDAALVEAAARLAGAASDKSQADEQALSAAEAERRAGEALETERAAHSAAHLASGLVIGEPCPVCRVVVKQLPGTEAPGELGTAEETLQVAKRSAGEARRTQTAMATEAARAEEAHRARLEQRAKLLGQVKDYPDSVGVAAAIEALRQVGAALAEARRAEDEARSGQQRAAKRSAEARAELSKAGAAYSAQRDAVSGIGPPAPRGELASDWSALVAWAATQRPQQAAVAASAETAAAMRTQERDRQLGSLRTACEVAGIDASPTANLGDLRAAAAAGLATAQAKVTRIEQEIAEADSLRTSIGGLLEQAGVARLLAGHLKSTGFERWLVAEALELLVDGASQTLRRLSGGQYSLARDERNEFLVVDHRNADERRPAKTLSGGETFQASLALALALADQLAGLAAVGAAKLESIFLDEGFGTLDPEALAVVADTVEALGSDERLVGIVTHVRELAERVPVRFEVTKNARTSLVERRSA